LVGHRKWPRWSENFSRGTVRERASEWRGTQASSCGRCASRFETRTIAAHAMACHLAARRDAGTPGGERRLPVKLSLAAVDTCLCRGGGGRRHCGLVCRDSLVSLSLGFAYSAHGNHPEQQGPNRREPRRLRRTK